MIGGIIAVAGVVALIIYVLFDNKKESLNKKPEGLSKEEGEISSDDQILQPVEVKKIENPNLFTTLKHRYFQIKGMYYRSIPSSLSGDFVGYAECENNPHDEYAVAIYHSKGVLLGYTIKGSQQLSDSIYTWHGGRVFCYGSIKYYKRGGQWSGSVSIPVGLRVRSMEALRQFEKEKKSLDDLIGKEELSIEDKFKALRWKVKIQEKYIEAGKSSKSIFSFPKTILPSLAMDLEKENRWDELAGLLEFSDEIQNNLSSRFAKTTMQRIEKAQVEILGS